MRDTGTHDDTVDPVLVFDDDGVRSEAPPDALRQPAPTRATMRALQRSSRPASRLPAMLGVLLFVILIVVAAILIVGKKHDNHNASTSTTAVVHHHSTKPSKGDVTTTTPSTIPTTTLPPQVSPETGTASAQGAEYAAPATAYNVNLTSTGPCWVYATLASTGNVVWTGVLEAGQSQVLQATGELEVELGHANTITATLNGVNVEYPTGYQAVFTMKFVPSTI